jgi:hypothetical protein
MDERGNVVFFDIDIDLDLLGYTGNAFMLVCTTIL